MNNATEIKYNKEQATHGVEQLKECQKELYEADELFYKGIMALGSAKGIDLIINEDSAINLYMPEKIVIECREGIANLIEEITTKIGLIEGFNQEPKETTDKVQNRELSKEVSDSKETVAEVQNKELVKEVATEEVPESNKNIQAVYDHPTEATELVATEQIKNNQLIYGPPGVMQEIETTQNNQLIYGPPAPVPSQETATTPTTPNPEYETIPDTGIPNVEITEKNYISKHPKLIGGLAATIGLFGLPTIISDDIDEQEELSYNRKKKD